MESYLLENPNSSSNNHAEMKFLNVLQGRPADIPPIWFMRQAGRYLPEYRALRQKAGSFLDLCFNPDFACEVTLQPIDRFDMDAAILFADILLIPHALGQDLSFVAGEGPRLDPVISHENIDQFRDQYDPEKLAPVYKTVSMVRQKLVHHKTLIGFAGAPWTVATYMLAGGPVKDPAALRAHYYENPAFVDQLMDLLVGITADYLIAQIEAGANALQLFDSWAGGLSPQLTRRLSLNPIVEITERVHAKYPDIPIIWFPKGVGAMAIEYARHPKCSALAIDTSTDPLWAAQYLSPHCVIQGGLDPLAVVAGGDVLERDIRTLCDAFNKKPYIFNLGHGFVPHTPIAHVEKMMELIRRA